MLTYGESGALLRSNQVPKLRRILVYAASVMPSQDHIAKPTRHVPGAFGSSSVGSLDVAPGERSQYRVTTPKLPPPPPVCAHHRSRCGSSGSLVAITALARPSASTTTT